MEQIFKFKNQLYQLKTLKKNNKKDIEKLKNHIEQAEKSME
jgi:hypothetical protein